MTKRRKAKKKNRTTRNWILKYIVARITSYWRKFGYFCEYNIRLKTEYSFLHFENTDFHYEHWNSIKLFSWLYKSSNYRILVIVFFFYEFFWRFNIYLLTVGMFKYMCVYKEKMFFNVKTNNCPWSCRGPQKVVRMTWLTCR